MITPLAHSQLDSQTFADRMRRQNASIAIVEISDLTSQVPHAATGGASKSSYFSPNSNRNIFVLERNGMYAADAYLNDVWQFAEDFSTQEAAEFLATLN